MVNGSVIAMNRFDRRNGRFFSYAYFSYRPGKIKNANAGKTNFTPSIHSSLVDVNRKPLILIENK